MGTFGWWHKAVYRLSKLRLRLRSDRARVALHIAIWEHASALVGVLIGLLIGGWTHAVGTHELRFLASTFGTFFAFSTLITAKALHAAPLETEDLIVHLSERRWANTFPVAPLLLRYRRWRDKERIVRRLQKIESKIPPTNDSFD